jgi:D-xylose transport system permease protein
VTKQERSSNPSEVRAEHTLETEPPLGDTDTAQALIGTGHEGSVADQFRAYTQRVRGGDMGSLPALAGLIVLGILFTSLDSVFFSKTNIANLMTQTAALMMLSMALTFVILIAEIDLSAGVTGGSAIAIWVLLVNQHSWNWVLALVVAVLCAAALGVFIGTFVAMVGIPSFVITLGLFLGLQGFMLVLLGGSGAYRVQTQAVTDIMNKSMAVWAGWAMLAVIVLVSLGTGLYDRRRRQAAGVATRPIALLWLRVAAWIVGGGFVVYLLSQDRSTGVFPITGVPIVVPIALGILRVGQSVLDRTLFGLHVFAVGGNPEAARRAGINVARVRIACFVICSSLAVLSGLFTASQVGIVQATLGRDIVLSGVGAAVIGGVSLFGGRGRLSQAAVGALLISMITNGLGLLGLSAGITFLVTGGVLILAATIDAVSRRRPGVASLAR